jgi:hypothetical protein
MKNYSKITEAEKNLIFEQMKKGIYTDILFEKGIDADDFHQRMLQTSDSHSAVGAV